MKVDLNRMALAPADVGGGTVVSDLSGGGNPAAGGNTASAGAPSQWHTGKFDTEGLGFLQSKGWHDKSAEEVALQAVQSYRQAQKFIGADENKLVRLPDQGDLAGWQKTWERLGAPEKPDGYDFSAVKFADGTDLDQDFVGKLQQASKDAGLTKDQATAVARAFVSQIDAAESNEATQSQIAKTTDLQTLQKEWGANFEINKAVATNAAKTLGVSQAVLDKLEGVAGFSDVFKLFHNIGVRIGEAKYISSEGGGNGGVFSAEQAVARKSALMKDSAWTAKYMAGDVAARQEMTNLNTIIVSAQAATGRFG